ncbi:MAG TPA: hypothetical protein ENG63_00915 [Candidatus Desulfofervidus auxilii]|uniref:Uncharacterized protein n=1 Tax=Desulfofervidus auxilii TaxID=1621989 RepID=A0A7C0Y826_DESA2|nr:hypothetical protein [Candidatus Desulfofervidus auxilii]
MRLKLTQLADDIWILEQIYSSYSIHGLEEKEESVLLCKGTKQHCEEFIEWLKQKGIEIKLKEDKNGN